MQHTVFFISDSNGITAETIGNSILVQFEGQAFVRHRLSFVDSQDKAHAAALRIKAHYLETGKRPIVVNTMADQSLCRIVAASGALMLDVFEPSIRLMEKALGTKRSGAVNRSHGLVDPDSYEARMNATNYALSHDDGVSAHYTDADLVLVGVSRSGKTPICLYMALHYGIKAANYPLTDEDLEKLALPVQLSSLKERVYGLTIESWRLVQVREQRRPGSRYATPGQCRWELERATALMRQAGIATLNTTHISIEEAASKIFARLGIERTMF